MEHASENIMKASMNFDNSQNKIALNSAVIKQKAKCNMELFLFSFFLSPCGQCVTRVFKAAISLQLLSSACTYFTYKFIFKKTLQVILITKTRLQINSLLIIVFSCFVLKQTYQDSYAETLSFVRYLTTQQLSQQTIRLWWTVM